MLQPSLYIDPPGAPRSLRTSTVTTTTIRLYWSPPLTLVPPRAAVTRYSVTCSSSGRPTRSVTTTATSTTVTGLTVYTLYSCCVRADSSVGLGIQSCYSRRTMEAGW